MMQEHDILLGQKADGFYLAFGGTESVVLHARTRAGKGVSFVIPNCFAWQGSLVVLDIKGEIARATAGYRREVLKQDVYILEPTSPSGMSHRWDPFGCVDRHSVDRFDAISQVGSQLFPEAQDSPSSSNSSAFWEPAGKQAMIAAATILAETPTEQLSMKAILDIFTRSDGAEWLARQIAVRRLSGDPYSRDAVYGISDFLNGPEQQTDGIRKTVSTRLAPWANPRIAASTSGADFNLRDLRRKPMTIYVVVSPAAMARVRPLLRLFFHQLIEACTDVTPEEDPTIKWQTLLMMDEFIRLGRMADFAESLQYSSGYGLRTALVVQSKPQVEARYGLPAAMDIFNNVGAEIVFGVNDLKLIKEVEERLGDNTRDVTTLNRPAFWPSFKPGKQSTAIHPHRRPLMLKQEVASLDREKQIVFLGGRKDLTQRICWYKDPNFKDLQRPMPVIPSLALEIAYDDGSTRVLRKRAPAMNEPAEMDQGR